MTHWSGLKNEEVGGEERWEHVTKKVVYFASNFLCFPYYYSKYFFTLLPFFLIWKWPYLVNDNTLFPWKWSWFLTFSIWHKGTDGWQRRNNECNNERDLLQMVTHESNCRTCSQKGGNWLCFLNSVLLHFDYQLMPTLSHRSEDSGWFFFFLDYRFKLRSN